MGGAHDLMDHDPPANGAAPQCDAGKGDGGIMFVDGGSTPAGPEPDAPAKSKPRDGSFSDHGRWGGRDPQRRRKPCNLQQSV